jgi:hypothetical protein
MKKSLTIILFFSLFINAKCKKEKQDEKEETPKIDVSKITTTDIGGASLGTVDNTDWTIDANWTSEELALFQTPSSQQLSGTETESITVFPAFPNPLNNVFTFVIAITKITCIQLVVTDDRLNVKERFIFKNALPGSGISLSQIKLDASKYDNNTNYRVYYGFYSVTDDLYLKGHGDIRIQR